MTVTDLFIIGGGINGCGIARDAAGRGLSVVLAEQGDLASSTSSASTKLFHGGLRYLEYGEIRLVREALIERETLLRAMPHISWPMRFVLPLAPDMLFDSTTPVSRLLSAVMPWLRGRRPAWMIRVGLALYDGLGGRKILPATRRLSLRGTPEGAPLRPGLTRAYEYSDCWVDDARLVVLNARDAAARGAQILTRAQVVAAERASDHWQITTRDPRSGAEQTHHARMLVNAAGPWVGALLRDTLGLTSRDQVRLVRGSHIVVPRLFDHDKAYFLQGADGRIMFMISYEGDFTLIGTTDAGHDSPDSPPSCTEDETRYMLDFVNGYLADPIDAADIVWRYSGVRPLYEDGAASASAATRDYVLTLDAKEGAPVLNIFGGKITTYRRLAESALEKIGTQMTVAAPWTAGVPLPGGDFSVGDVEAQVAALLARYPFLVPGQAQRLIRAYGTEAAQILGEARAAQDLGQDFGGGLTEVELRWMIDHEYARTAEDVLWRRSKLGLRLSDAQAQHLTAWMQQHAG